MERTVSEIWRRGLAASGALLALGVAYALFAWNGGPQAPSGTHVLPHGVHHWDGWTELTPTILLPRTRLGDDLTRVFVRFPPRGRVTLAGSERESLRVPPGTIIDRVEYRK